jgi:hypothetical protein
MDPDARVRTDERKPRKGFPTHVGETKLVYQLNHTRDDLISRLKRPSAQAHVPPQLVLERLWKY